MAAFDAPMVYAASAALTLDDFRKSYAVGGIDLSQTTDLTAASVIICLLYTSLGTCFKLCDRFAAKHPLVNCILIFFLALHRQVGSSGSYSLCARLIGSDNSALRKTE